MRYNFRVQWLGFKVSPEGVPPLDGEMRSLLELGIRNEGSKHRGVLEYTLFT